MKRPVFVILLVAISVLSLAAATTAAPRPGFSGGHPGGHFAAPSGGHFVGPSGGHFAGHRRFDGRRFVHHDRFHVFVSPFFFAAPIVAAPVFVAPPPPVYWYYCPSYGGYYPYVPACPEPWVPLPAP